MADTLQKIFWMHSLERKFMYLVKILLNYILKGPTEIKSVLVQMITWRWTNTLSHYQTTDGSVHWNIDGLVQDCSNSSALAMELLQSCTKPWIYMPCQASMWFLQASMGF